MVKSRASYSNTHKRLILYNGKMAPIRSTTKQKATSRPSAALNQSSARAESSSGSLFHATKADKRIMKRSLLLSKIAGSHTKSQKRRRPNRKLVATLEELADALPDTDVEGGNDGNGPTIIGQAKVTRGKVTAGGRVNELKSLKPKPGIRKKKEEIGKKERERFGLNLAEMMKAPVEESTNGRSTAVEQRWAALKRFVEGNVERRADFA